MNGDTCNGVEEEKEKEYSALIFAPAPSRSPKSDCVVEMDGALEVKLDSSSSELILKRLLEHHQLREQTVRAKLARSALLFWRVLPDALC